MTKKYKHFRDRYSVLDLVPIDEYDEGRRIYMLNTDFTYDDPTYGFITVPKGFKTDLASVPRAFISAVPKDGRYLHASVVHDYFYISNDIPRLEADTMFYRAMRGLGVKTWRRTVIFLGVRMFGVGNYPKEKVGLIESIRELLKIK